MRPRQDRAIVGPAQRDGDRLRVPDGDDRLAGDERLPALRRAVAGRIGGVQLLKLDVLIVGPGGRDAPAQIGIPPGQHRRNPRNRRPDHPARSQFQPRQIPKRGRRKIDMRVIGQERPPGGRPRRRRRPGVRGTAKGRLHPWQEGQDLAPQRGKTLRHIGDEAGIGRQGGGARPADLRHQILGPAGIEKRKPCPQDFRGNLRRGVEGHQLQDGEAIGRLPIGNLVVEQEELRRAAPLGLAVHDPDPGVHTLCIGLQSALHVGVLRSHRPRRQPVKVKPPHQLIGPDRLGPEHFRQPPLHGPAQDRHLPKPVLGMGKAQRVIDILIRRTEDMRHVRRIAHDLKRGGNPLDLVIAAIFRQGSRGEIIDQQKRRDGQDRHRHEDAQKPAKSGQHGRSARSP